MARVEINLNDADIGGTGKKLILEDYGQSVTLTMTGTNGQLIYQKLNWKEIKQLYRGIEVLIYGKGGGI